MSRKSSATSKSGVSSRIHPQRVAELEALAALPDEAIDTSDIPPLSDDFWANAKPGMFRPVKQQLTLRLDADLVAWFKHHEQKGRGYQTRINQALREYVRQHDGKGR